MENKKIAILFLAIVAALVLAASATYAMMGRQGANTGNPYGSATNGYRMGTSMMGGYGGGMRGGYSGHGGGTMGGYGMMRDFGMDSMYQHMQGMWNYLNSTASS